MLPTGLVIDVTALIILALTNPLAEMLLEVMFNPLIPNNVAGCKLFA